MFLGLGLVTLVGWSAPKLDRVTLQLKWRHQFQFAGYYAAIAQGYYREAGLEVVLLEPDVGEEPADAVLAGKAQFGLASSDLVLQHAAGRPVVALAAILQHSAQVFLVRADAGISSIHDLAGKRVMLEAHAEELLAYLQDEGIGRDAVTWVPHTFNPEALIAGSVDAMSSYVSDEPFLLEEAGVGYQTFTPRSSGIDFYGDTLFTTRDEVARNPRRVAAFRAASLRGWLYALDHQEEMVNLIYSHYSQRHSREHLRFEAEQLQRLILPDVVEIGYQNPGRWRHIADTYHRLGMVGPDLPLDGFVYDADRKPDLSRFYVALLVAFAVIVLLVGGLVRFARMNRQIRLQSASLEKALGEIKELRGIIPICAGCKKIRNDSGYWDQVETYIEAHTRAEFSHGICEDCMTRLYPEYIPPIEPEDRG